MRPHVFWYLVSCLRYFQSSFFCSTYQLKNLLELIIPSATIAAIVKTVELKNLTEPDFTYETSNLSYWFMTENFTIIIAACIPTLKPLVTGTSSTSANSGPSGKKNQYQSSSGYRSTISTLSGRKPWLGNRSAQATSTDGPYYPLNAMSSSTVEPVEVDRDTDDITKLGTTKVTRAVEVV